MCERFVRWINVGGLERFEPPMKRSETTNRALIAEFAFSLFAERMQRKAEKKSEEGIEEAAWQATENRLAPFVTRGLSLSRELSSDEQQEVAHITKSLIKFFESEKQMLIRPLFPGCGYIDASEGDVVIGSTLYEIKTVERAFRGADIRQLITYGALNFASTKYNITGFGLFNPRAGIFFEGNVEVICHEISGKSSDELFSAVVQAISSGELSR